MTVNRAMVMGWAMGVVVLGAGVGARAVPAAASDDVTPAVRAARVVRGDYLVQTSGCHDCHTPFTLGPNGPEPDMTRALSGHPADVVMPPAPALPAGPWGWVGALTNTAYAGPWGVSFTANLTSDPETGLGRWTEDMFLAAIRTGRHQGKGRPIMPPMPWPVYRNMTDEDLKSIFAYLQTLKPVRNQVPQVIDPAEAK